MKNKSINQKVQTELLFLMDSYFFFIMQSVISLHISKLFPSLVLHIWSGY